MSQPQPLLGRTRSSKLHCRTLILGRSLMALLGLVGRTAQLTA